MSAVHANILMLFCENMSHIGQPTVSALRRGENGFISHEQCYIDVVNWYDKTVI